MGENHKGIQLGNSTVHKLSIMYRKNSINGKPRKEFLSMLISIPIVEYAQTLVNI